MRYNLIMQKVLVDFLEKYKEKVDAEIVVEIERRLAEVREISPHLVPVVEAMKELSVGGKRLRAMLTILGCQIAGARTAPLQEIVKAAVAMELFHLGLLIHDDIMDRDDLRRGIKTIHVRYDDPHFGETIAINAGDETYGWCVEILGGLQLPPDVVNKAIQVWGKYFTRVGYGQMLDVMADQRGETSDGEVLKVLAIKSGEYSCVLPLLLGATLGGVEQKILDKLEKYGMELGWVFQLRDDWLAEYGDPAATGKPVGNDSREGKRTFVTMYGRERAEAAIAEHMTQAKEWGLSLQGDSSQGLIFAGLVEWMGTREN